MESVLMIEAEGMAGVGGSKKIYIQIELLLYIDLVD
jgi:hypothetical protein